MAWEELGAGNVMDVGSIGQYVDQIADGEYARLRFDLRASPAGWMVEQIQSKLDSAGVPGARVTTGSPVLNIDWIVKREDKSGISMEPLTAVAIIVAAVVVLAIVIIGWSVWRSQPAIVQSGMIMVGAIVFLVLALASVKGKKLVTV